jgi:hypothetical protein
MFLVKYVEGAGDGLSHFLGVKRGSHSVDADNPAAAYIITFRYFTQRNQDVKVIERNGSPLGFSNEALAIIRDAGVPIEEGYPKSGIQIEEILPLPHSEI